MLGTINRWLTTIFLVLLLSGCATTGPGPFSGGNFQQVVISPQQVVKEVTVLRLTPDSQEEMIHMPDTVVIGKSMFQIDSDEIDNQVLEAQAKAQAKDVNANVVLLSVSDLGPETKTKTVQKKSAFQQAAEDVPLVVGGQSYSRHSSSSRKTQYSTSGSRSTTKRHSSTFGAAGVATLGELTALIPGSVVDETEEYEAELYEIHAIFLRTPNYSGL